MKPIYLDYSATTPVKQEVLDAMIPYFTEKFGNPSSLYGIGFASKDAIELARSQVAALIGAEDREIYFTSGGTEADNWAVIGAARSRKNKGNHIITTKIEHHALLHTCKALEKEGFVVTYLDVDDNGIVDPAQVKNAITDQTILISVMFANNEIGTLQPIAEIGAIAKENGILFHSDGVQALGNVDIDVRSAGVDMMSMSAHKIYGPKGIGALYIRKGVVIENILFGGGQENKRRAGTENLTGIVGFGKAAELAGKNLNDHIKQVRDLRNYFLEQIRSRIDDISVNGDLEKRLPGNLNLIFNYVEGEALLLHLDIRGICASTGSACSSASFSPSHVLSAMGLPLEKVYSSLRFTVGDFTTKEDLDLVVASLVEIVSKLRELSPFDKDHRMQSTQVLR
ncbi:MAG: cysteine desulfurase NifS [Firmicutes bacterium HGW-Firmicutes-11]|jgi:cysteine desulfurase|nr:MAG: cysteine desulfurase NifS [Firmicutes bacterium HGW-Firmicutes-11]